MNFHLVTSVNGNNTAGNHNIQIRDCEYSIDRQIREAKEKQIDECAKAAAKYGRIYAPISEDFWFKHVLAIDNRRVPEAFLRAITALTFRHFDTSFLCDRMLDVQKSLDKKLIGTLSARPDSNRRVETDFACTVEFKNPEGIKTTEDYGNNVEIKEKLKSIQENYDTVENELQEFTKSADKKAYAELLELEGEYPILCDALKRGFIFSSEMQVKLTKGVYNMYNRSSDYVAFLQARDHGKENSNMRPLKKDVYGDISRSIGEIIFEVNDENKSIATCVNCPAQKFETAHSRRGNIITYIPLPKIESELLSHSGRTYINKGDNELSENEKNLKDDFITKVQGLKDQSDKQVNEFFKTSKITNDTKKIVQEVIFVMGCSTLMWPRLVNSFSKVVREMCKNLEITKDNMDKISDVEYSNYYRELIGLDGILNEEMRKKNKEIQKRDEEIQKLKQLVEEQKTKIAKLELGNMPVSETQSSFQKNTNLDKRDSSQVNTEIVGQKSKCNSHNNHYRNNVNQNDKLHSSEQVEGNKSSFSK